MWKPDICRKSVLLLLVRLIFLKSANNCRQLETWSDSLLRKRYLIFIVVEFHTKNNVSRYYPIEYTRSKVHWSSPPTSQTNMPFLVWFRALINEMKCGNLLMIVEFRESIKQLLYGDLQGRWPFFLLTNKFTTITVNAELYLTHELLRCFLWI